MGLFKRKPKEQYDARKHYNNGQYVIAREIERMEYHPYYSSYVPTKVKIIKGIITNVGLTTIKINDEWYSIDSNKVGGIIIDDIIDE